MLDQTLLARFEKAVSLNTLNSTESLGYFFGHNSSGGRYWMNSLFIPPQTGTQSTCSEEGFMASKVLEHVPGACLLGWVHTHPNWSTKPSSIDLHQQCMFQRIGSHCVSIIIAYNKEVRKDGTTRKSVRMAKWQCSNSQMQAWPM